MVVERRAEATVGSIGEGNGSIFVVLSKKKRNDFVCGWRGDSKYWSLVSVSPILSRGVLLPGRIKYYFIRREFF